MTLVLLWSGALFGVSAVPASAQKIYWTQSSGVDAKIRRSELDGSNIQDLVTCGLNVPSGLAPDRGSGRIYWINNDKVQRAGIDIPAGETACARSDIETLVTAPPGRDFHDVVLDTCRGLMFYNDGGTVPPTPTSIFRADLNGSNPQAIITIDPGRWGGFLALDSCAGKLYWNANDAVPTFKIQRANLDGTNVEDLVTGPGGVREVQLDVPAGKMYWTSSVSAARIYRANLEIPTGETPSTRTDIEELICPPVVGSDTQQPYGLLLDPDNARMYWSDTGTAKIYIGQMTIPAAQTCSNRSDIVQPPTWTGFNATALAFETGTCTDCNANDIPDECEADCNANGCPDECDIVPGIVFSAAPSLSMGTDFVSAITALASTVTGLQVPLDLNNDNHTDLAVVSIGGQSLRVFIGNGDGTFLPAMIYLLVGTRPGAIVAGRFDDDSHIDIVVGYQGDFGFTPRLEFFKNSGDGSGTLLPPTGIPMSFDCSYLVAADLDGDQRLDIINVRRLGTPPTLGVLKNLGGGNFGSSVNFLTANPLTNATVGDFDGDSKPDVAVVAHDHATLYVFYNSGSGVFDSTLFEQPPVSIYPGEFPTYPAAADMDGDTFIDLVVSNNGESGAPAGMALLWNNGNGTFTPPELHPGGGEMLPVANALADLDNDGLQDIAVGVHGGPPFVLQNLGNRDFVPARRCTDVYPLPAPIAAGDFNEDGRADLAGHEAFGPVDILLNDFGPLSTDCNGNGVPDECDVANCPIGDFACGDCDGDGVPNECEGPTLGCPNGLKNRYISFAPGTGTSSVALRVEKQNLGGLGGPPGICWVDTPNAMGNAKCLSAPLFRVWNESVIHVGDCEIVPVARYHVQATADGLVFDNPRIIDTIAEPILNLKKWGDVVGQFVGTHWTSPNRFTNVNDVQAIVEYIQGTGIVPAFQSVNLEAISSNDPCLNNFVNTADVLIIVKAAMGDPYPFITDPASCPVCP